MTRIFFGLKIFEAKLDANKKYQLFESCYKNADTVQCRLSSLADSATYGNNFLKPMTVQAQQQQIFFKSNKLYKKRLGLRDIKAVGLRENYAKLIDNKFHEEMCPNPLLDVWIKVEKHYPLGTRIEREFKENKGVIHNTTVTAIDLEPKQYKLKWDDKNEHTEKEDNYTGDQIGIYLHPEELPKFEVGEMVRKSLL